MQIIARLKSILGSGDRDSFRQRFIRGTIWNLIGTVASRGSSLVAGIASARILGRSGYGELGIIISTVNMFATFATLGLGLTATRYIAEFEGKDNVRLGRIIGITSLVSYISGGFMSLIMFLGAPIVATKALGAPHLVMELRIAAILLLFSTINGVQNGSLAGFQDFKQIARIGVIQAFYNFPLMIGGVYFWGLKGAVMAMVISALIGLFLYKLALNNVMQTRNLQVDYRGARQEAGVLWKTSIPAMLSGVMVVPVIWLSNTFLVNTHNGFAQLGLFNAANQWRTFLEFLPAVMGSVLLPIITASKSGENSKIETVNVLLSWVMVIVIALPLISFPEIIGFLYGHKYASISFYRTLDFLMFVSCIVSYFDGIARKLVANNLLWWGLANNILWAVILLVLVNFLKIYGATGLSVSYLIAYIVTTVVFLPFFLKKKVVPKRLLFSKEVMLVWVILIMQIIVANLGISLLFRLILFAVFVFVLIFSVYQLWRTASRNVETAV